MCCYQVPLKIFKGIRFFSSCWLGDREFSHPTTILLNRYFQNVLLSGAIKVFKGIRFFSSCWLGDREFSHPTTILLNRYFQNVLLSGAIKVFKGFIDIEVEKRSNCIVPGALREV
jgi:hypothetical protein